MSWIKKKFVSFSIIIFSCLIGVTVIEIGLRLVKSTDQWVVTEEANILRNFQFSYDISNLYPTDVSVTDYVRNEYGLRDDCENPDDIEILTIGGSTTDQRYVPFEFTYQTVLQQRLRAAESNFGCVSNAGVDGHSSWGHLFAFDKWFPLISDLNPKFILLYVGVNDANFLRTDSPNAGFDTNTSGDFKRYLKGFHVVRALLPIYRLPRQRSENASAAYAGHAPRPYEYSDYTVTVMNEETRRLTTENAAAFKSRMSAILNEIRMLNAIPICVTQPHRYVITKEDGQTYGIPSVLGDGFSGLDYDFSIQQLNSVLFELCGVNTVDLYSHNFLNSHFYDGVHTTSLGSQEIGETLADFIISRFY
uniref:GDSL-like Lipase/Acylhydrolase family n=1 Tax=Candidatus Kentrum sp. LPFa TaxID=2126335 RepID=A0A450XWI8_9GAMM|nr:MAG: GDSL-like Lipase/Acylhydrolase family [Candidatus Kentron sp. LPFa]VFK33648.1 MAG: GDSL-like Lipase/Acylhydrolase family [Candidatus Kentron sp. LPFa]